jgi:hypothetical protein
MTGYRRSREIERLMAERVAIEAAQVNADKERRDRERSERLSGVRRLADEYNAEEERQQTRRERLFVLCDDAGVVKLRFSDGMVWQEWARDRPSEHSLPHVLAERLVKPMRCVIDAIE